MRTGPHPLPVHLGMVASNLRGLNSEQFGAVDKISEADAIRIMRGIKAYQKHPFERSILPFETVWMHGQTKLIKPLMPDFENINHQNTLLVVPSLINKSNILDITEDQSFIRWCTKSGVNTFLLDWGDLTLEDDISIQTVFENKLKSAIQCVSNISNGPIDVMGYCMGGTLLTAAYFYAPEHIRRMILLAAPWDFQEETFEFAKYTRIAKPLIEPIMSKKNRLQSEYIQAIFAALDPAGAAKKFMTFSELDHASDRAHLFVAVEDWLNDGVDLPHSIAQYCMQEWFVNNSLVKGGGSIGTKCFDLSLIDKNVLILASHKDKVVPFGSAIAISTSLTKARVSTVELNCGHVGQIVGRNAKNNVWQPILDFVQQ